jgi:hypothetical protein
VRYISFALTTEQVRRQTKTVTRRIGWLCAMAGMRLQPVEKCQGLKKGETIVTVGAPIRIVYVRREPLGAITQEDCEREGFPTMAPSDFVRFFSATHSVRELRGEPPKWIMRRPGPDDLITRIEFEYESSSSTLVGGTLRKGSPANGSRGGGTRLTSESAPCERRFS